LLINVRSSEAASFRGPLLVDTFGIPRYWVLVWLSYLPTDLAHSTITKKLAGIDGLYRYSEEYHGSGYLDDALASLNEDALGDTLEGFFFSIKNRPPITPASEERWQAALQFVIDIIRRLGRSSDRFDAVSSRLSDFELLQSHLHVGRRRRPERIRSLPAVVVNALYEMLAPDSADNPFRAGQTRWLVYTVFILLLHQGLRRGELLSCPVDVVKAGLNPDSGERKYWMSVRYNEYEDEEDDPRYTKPSIKNLPSVRQIPVTEVTARLVENYVLNHRGKVEHSFLLNSQKRRPLSHESVTKIFKKISDSLPDAVRTALRDHTGGDTVTAHDLRHTCAVIRLNQFLKADDMQDALKKLRVFFGWSRESDMPERYARAVFEHRLSSVWEDKFDDRVELLRNISPRMKP
jgi:integrase